MKYLFVATLFASLTAPAYASQPSVEHSEKSAKALKITHKGRGMNKVRWVNSAYVQSSRAATFNKPAPYSKY